MSRYIDADALMADLDKGLWGKDYDKVLAEAIIREAPSIDICFCKDCRYRLFGGTCEYTDIAVDADDFCSYGEREGE